jgi:hypothetical protein
MWARRIVEGIGLAILAVFVVFAIWLVVFVGGVWLIGLAGP